MKPDNHYVYCRTCKKRITFSEIETHDKTHKVIIRMKRKHFAVDIGIFVTMEMLIIYFAVQYLKTSELLATCISGLMGV